MGIFSLVQREKQGGGGVMDRERNICVHVFIFLSVEICSYRNNKNTCLCVHVHT